MKEVHLADHIIYGEWDDTHGSQFLVHYHPNGIHCTIFLMGGCDYGGGITHVISTWSELFETCLKEHTDREQFWYYLLEADLRKLKRFGEIVSLG